jgi:hypothetical protein
MLALKDIEAPEAPLAILYDDDDAHSDNSDGIMVALPKAPRPLPIAALPDPGYSNCIGNGIAASLLLAPAGPGPCFGNGIAESLPLAPADPGPTPIADSGQSPAIAQPLPLALADLEQPLPIADGVLVGPLPLAPAAPPRDRRDRAWIPGLNGAQVSYHDYVGPSGNRYTNFLLKCPLHHSCNKTKGAIGALSVQLGRTGPLAFLHAWVDCDQRPGRSHAASMPTPASVRAFHEAHSEALEALCSILVV